jgi:hypothetical protein
MKIDRKRMLAFVKLRNVEPITKWEDIKEGEIYHMPPLIYNKRFDFVVMEKGENHIKIRKFCEFFMQTIYRTDITSRFIVKKVAYVKA